MKLYCREKVYEFGDLLEGVKAEILSTPNDTTPAPNTADTMQTGKIYSEIAHLKAFDEITKSQILQVLDSFPLVETKLRVLGFTLIFFTPSTLTQFFLNKKTKNSK